MAAVPTEEMNSISSTAHAATPDVWAGNGVAVDLGIWLAGLRSFIGTGGSAFFASESSDRTREARVLHASLLRMAMLTAMLSDPKSADEAVIADLEPLTGVLRDSIFVGEELITRSVSIAAYNAWCRTLADRLERVAATHGLIISADGAGESELPAVLRRVVDEPEPTADMAELALVLPRFGRVLRYLRVIGGMLERDEPLKPSILIFSTVNEMIYDLTGFINGRLERFHDTEAEMFGTLDAASYTASLELKKVYSQELAGVSSLRPAPSVYARTETAYSLLNDGFHLILAGFAKVVDPSSDVFEIFPAFKLKRERSIVLKRELLSLIGVIQAAEATPEPTQIDAMDGALREFMMEPVTYLFYKDTETVERFVEEIAMTRPNSDLVPLLHRFGAYLDTLLGQVLLRSVLADVS